MHNTNTIKTEIYFGILFFEQDVSYTETEIYDYFLVSLTKKKLSNIMKNIKNKTKINDKSL